MHVLRLIVVQGFLSDFLSPGDSRLLARMAGILGGGRRARVESWRTLVSLLAFQRAARCLAAFIPAPRLSALPYHAACPLMCLIACLLSFVVARHAAAAVLYFYPLAGTQLPQHGHIVQKRNTRRYSQECIPRPCCIESA